MRVGVVLWSMVCAQEGRTSVANENYDNWRCFYQYVCQLSSVSAEMCDNTSIYSEVILLCSVLCLRYPFSSYLFLRHDDVMSPRICRGVFALHHRSLKARTPQRILHILVDRVAPVSWQLA